MIIMIKIIVASFLWTCYQVSEEMCPLSKNMLKCWTKNVSIFKIEIRKVSYGRQKKTHLEIRKKRGL